MKVSPFVREARLSGALEKSLRRILLNQKLALHGLDAEPIHDLRVALRRSRSLAEGFAEMDPQPVWRDLRKACRLQQSDLSELRDSHVLTEWIRKLGLGLGPSGQTLVAVLAKEESRGRRKAKASLKSFSREQWKGWLHSLPASAGSLAVGPSRLARIAFDRANDVCSLDRRWRRTHSVKAWHQLRLAVKRFRYAVESFLPGQDAAWGPDLKRLQDILGEGHDLDVLRAQILQFAKKKSLPKTTADQWLLRVAGARDQRTARYLRATGVAGRTRMPSSSRGKIAVTGMPEPKYIYDSWRWELGRLAKVNPADVAKPTASLANRG